MKEIPQQCYAKTAKGKAVYRRYAETAKGKATRLRAHKKWIAKPKNKRIRNAGVRIRYHHQRQMLADIKIQAGCCDYGYNKYSVALDFDHRDPKIKTFAIAKAYGSYSDERLLAEAAKCDIRCANCHRVKTAKGGFHGNTTEENGLLGGTHNRSDS